MKSSPDNKYNREIRPTEYSDSAFSRRIKLSELQAGRETHLSIVLNKQETSELAKFLNIPKIVSFKCTIKLKPSENGWLLLGDIKIVVCQLCVISLEKLQNNLKIPIKRQLLIHNYTPSKESMPLNLNLVDTDPLHEYLELGDLISEEIILALPQYPKKKGVEFEPNRIPISIDDRPNYFQELSKLKQTLEQSSLNKKID